MVVKVAIFHNTPGGGGIRLLNQVHSCLEKSGVLVEQYTITEPSGVKSVDPYDDHKIFVKPWVGFIQRLVWICTVLPSIHQKLATEINQQKFDFVIVTHDYFTKSPYICRYLKSKVYYLLHEPQREFYENFKIHCLDVKDLVANILRFPIKLIEIQNTKFVDKIYVNSKYSQGVIKKIFGRESTIIYPRVDTEYFCPDRKVKKENLILSIGGLSKVKGHDFIIKSLYPLLGRYTLVIIGSGRNKDLEYLKKLASNKRKFIRFESNFSDYKILNLYRKSLLLCIGARLEPFGLTSLEAQSVGTPVVGVAEGGIPETIINGETGYTVPRESTAFLEAVIKTLANYHHLGRKARQKMRQNWDIKKFKNDIDTILR